MSQELRIATVTGVLIRRHFGSDDVHGRPSSKTIENTAVLILSALDAILVNPKTLPPGDLFGKISRALTNSDGLIAAGARQDLDALEAIVRNLQTERDRAVSTNREVTDRCLAAEAENEVLADKVGAIDCKDPAAEILRLREQVQREIKVRDLVAEQNAVLRDRIEALEREAIAVVRLLVDQNAKIHITLANAVACSRGTDATQPGAMPGEKGI